MAIQKYNTMTYNPCTNYIKVIAEFLKSKKCPGSRFCVMKMSNIWSFIQDLLSNTFIKNSHLHALEPVLMRTSYNIWSLYPQKYRKVYILPRNNPEIKCWPKMSGFFTKNVLDPAFRNSELLVKHVWGYLCLKWLKGWTYC